MRSVFGKCMYPDFPMVSLFSRHYQAGDAVPYC